MNKLNDEIFSEIHNHFVDAFKHHIKLKRKWLIHIPNGRVGSCDMFSAKNIKLFSVTPIAAVVDFNHKTDYFVQIKFSDSIAEFLSTHSISEFFGMCFFGGGMSEERYGNKFSTKADICDISVDNDHRFYRLSEDAAQNILSFFKARPKLE